MDALNTHKIHYQTHSLTVAYQLHTYRKNNPGISRTSLCTHFAEYGLNTKAAHQFIAPLDNIGSWPEDVRAKAQEMGLKWTRLKALAAKDIAEVRKELDMGEVIQHVTRNQIQELLEKFDDLKSEVLAIDRAQENLEQVVEKIRQDQTEFFTRVQTQMLSSVSKMLDKQSEDTRDFMAAYVDQRLEHTHQALNTLSLTVAESIDKQTQAISAMIAEKVEPELVVIPATPVAPPPPALGWKSLLKLIFPTCIGLVLAVFIVLLVKNNSEILGTGMESLAIAGGLEATVILLSLYRARVWALRYLSRAGILGLAILSGSILHTGNAKKQADEIARLQTVEEVSRREELSKNESLSTLRKQEQDLVGKLQSTSPEFMKVRTALDAQLGDVRNRIELESSKQLAQRPPFSLDELRNQHKAAEAIRWAILLLIPLLCWIMRDSIESWRHGHARL